MSNDLRTASIASPVGPLLLTEQEGALIAVDWLQRRRTAPETAADKPAPTPSLERARIALQHYFSGTLRVFDLATAPTGTPFQKRVWAEMSRIPYGETITYGELARRVGSSARAVGNACGANPLPIIVPCHRVLGAGGALGGYSGAGGADTKSWLLAHESRNAARTSRGLASAASA